MLLLLCSNLIFLILLERHEYFLDNLGNSSGCAIKKLGWSIDKDHVEWDAGESNQNSSTQLVRTNKAGNDNKEAANQKEYYRYDYIHL